MERKKINTIIVVLAVLLGISLAALGGTLIYNRIASHKQTTAVVPDNLITPETDETAPDGESTDRADDGTTKQNSASDSASKTKASGTTRTTSEKKAATIRLYNKQPKDNTPFTVVNMFPGDSETKYFRVLVSYHDSVTVHYKATVRPGYEKLAEVLKVRIKLLTTGEIMYDGLMRDMPESVTYKLASAESTTSELYYEITAYLETSVGNAYQNKELIADFSWWVEETGNLDRLPNTGYDPGVLLWAVLAVCSGVILIITRKRKRKEDEADG